MKLKGKTILITGGASGIGLEAAKQFLAIGAKVIITGRTQSKLDAVKKAFPSIVTIQSDAGKEADAQALFEKVKALGGIDILYNNAGVLVPPANLGIPNDKHLEGAAYEMEVNYLGVIRLNNLFLDMLNSRNESAIINTTSILSITPSLIEATYSSSKTALAFYTISLREHLKIIGSKVKIFELIPPLVATEMTVERKDKKITPEKMIEGLINGLSKDHYTIRVGDAKIFSFINRFFPKIGFNINNPKQSHQLLKN
ncbi:teichoic and lipoteichoic acid D-alanine esterification [Chryseobacterium sp. StRB126]|uniref:SDR family oxidoreductase n=1 Tax=Chryseobacterium sp. StRB126 TaxID=878220 RepID=UPI0004E98C94|nr:SDR family NAD(P)-dependent oxidoreductase [Chryseobacterium sp. StRB126]BAP31207.1 teichoic and lipoteichoic acid D-alanine esterification [Chryseobacterium sp. StRB126]